MILLVEDDPIVSEVIVAHFRQAGMEIVTAADAAGGLRLFGNRAIELVLVDVNLPDGSGHDLVRDLRQRRDCAVIYVTGRDGIEDRLRGLQSADDYLVKPVDPRELEARTRAVLRRYRARRPADTVLQIGAWTLDIVRRELADGAGAVLRLTRGEFDLIAALAQAGDLPLSREFLVEVLGAGGAEGKPRTVDVLVSRIRGKLAQAGANAPRIVTVFADGYRLAGGEE